MAFFDKLSKTVTEASQKTIAKTKELADASKLNSTISEQERAINIQYLKLGKLYATIHREDFEEAFAEMMSNISQAEAKIQECKNQIMEIKGVRKCERCGAEVPMTSAFCQACGAGMPKVQTATAPDQLKCPRCGAEVKKGMRFCTSCGKAMEAPAAPVVQEPKVEVVLKKTCSNCGAVLEADAAFCEECGTKVEQ